MSAKQGYRDVFASAHQACHSHCDALAIAFLSPVLNGPGASGAGRYVGYAGAIASQPAWTAFGEAWTLVLERYGLAYLDVGEAFSDQFVPTPIEGGTDAVTDFDRLLFDLGALAEPYRVSTFGSVSEVAAHATTAELVKQKRQMFDGALLNVLEPARSTGKLMLVGDISKDSDHSYRLWLDELRTTQVLPPQRLLGLCFMDDRLVHGLQYVTMFGWLVCNELERVLNRRAATMQTMLYNLLIQDSDARCFDCRGRPVQIGNLL